MNTGILAASWMNALGAALLHFLWEAGVVAAVVALMQARQPAAPPARRYARYCVALLALPLVFVATLVWMHAGGGTGWAAAALAHWARPQLLPYIAGLWALGVTLMGVRALGGWMWLRRARREATRQLDGCVPQSWQQVLRRLQAAMRVAGTVGLGVSRRVLGPCVLGWWRPLILVPASALTGWDGAQLEALLAHELAHIARRDYLVNVAQRAVEALFFYHPAVWWLSTQVTQEREHCCDDAAIAVCGDRVRYARALVEAAAASLQPTPRRELACAAHDGELRPRVLRILGLPVPSAPLRLWAALTLMLALLGAGAWLHAPQPPRALTPAPAATATLPLPPHSWASLVTPLPKQAIQPQAAASTERPGVKAPRPAQSAALTPALAPPAAPVRQREVVTFSFAAVESCTPQWRWVRYVAPDGQQWIAMEPVMSCVPVLQPTEVWVSNL